MTYSKRISSLSIDRSSWLAQDALLGACGAPGALGAVVGGDLHQLLGDGGSALAHAPVADVGHQGAEGAADVDAAVGEKFRSSAATTAWLTTSGMSSGVAGIEVLELLEDPDLVAGQVVDPADLRRLVAGAVGGVLPGSGRNRYEAEQVTPDAATGVASATISAVAATILRRAAHGLLIILPVRRPVGAIGSRPTAVSRSSRSRPRRRRLRPATARRPPKRRRARREAVLRDLARAGQSSAPAPLEDGEVSAHGPADRERRATSVAVAGPWLTPPSPRPNPMARLIRFAKSSTVALLGVGHYCSRSGSWVVIISPLYRLHADPDNATICNCKLQTYTTHTPNSVLLVHEHCPFIDLPPKWCKWPLVRSPTSWFPICFHQFH